MGLALLLVLPGCTDLSRASVDAMKLSLHRHVQVNPTAASVAALPYYQLQAQGPDGSAVLILGNIDGTREAWYGKQQTILFIEHGRVVQTLGLRQNLDHLQWPAANPFARGLQTLPGPVDYALTMDWSPDYRYGVPVSARLTPAGREQITIIGTVHEVLRVDELLIAPAAHFRAINHYWVDPQDGFVWKSEQTVAPGMTLQLQQLRPHREKQS